MLKTVNYDDVFERWAERFNFFPDYYGNSVGINEPESSVTIHWNGFDETEIAVIDEIVYGACASLGYDLLYALDWQHECYEFSPILDIGNVPVSVFPDGDYHIITTKDFAFGTFGHPWRNTICFWGDKFIKMAESKMPVSFRKEIRVNGKMV